MERSRPRSDLATLFDKALAVGGWTHDREDIARGLVEGRFQYWGDDECCLVTEFVDYPKTRKLHIFLAAGDLDRILHVYVPQLREFARENGCSAITCIGRRGFLRRLPEHGFEPKSVAFEMKIEEDANV